MKFDWYQATVKTEDLSGVISAINDGLGGGEIARVRGMFNYHNGFEINNGSGVLAKLYAGGPNGGVHVLASSHNTEAMVALLRAQFKDHRVTRMDACEDFDEPDAWKRLFRALRRIARENNVTTEYQGDYETGKNGRTFYVGKRGSNFFIRLYEKGKQMRCLNFTRADEFSKNWVRVEAQFRPQDDARDRAALLPARGVFGASALGRKVAERCFNIAVPRFVGARHDLTDDEKSLEANAAQYGKVLERLRLRLGSWDAVGRDIGRRVIRQEATAQARKDIWRGNA